MKPYYEHAGITIYHGDCREVLPQVSARVLLTDPPYGVGVGYESFTDTRENVATLVADVSQHIRRFNRAAITCGQTQIWMYPNPTWILCWYVPSGAGQNPWGFTCWQPILV